MATDEIKDAMSIIGTIVFGVVCMSVLLVLYLAPIKFSNLENSLENAI